MDELDKIIADRLDKLLGKEGLDLRREDVARGMRTLGFRWSANKVTQVVRGNRSLSVLELAGICAVLGRPVAEILGDEGALEGSARGELRPGVAVPVTDVWKALMGISGWPATEEGADRGVVVYDEATVKAARSLGLRPEQVDAAAEHLWGRPLGAERDQRVGDNPTQGRRGHVTRDLLSQLKAHLATEARS